MTVPNLFPTRASNLRLAVIGEAPGKDEEQAGRPFVGASGRFLAALLSRAGTSYESCFFGNISQHRPPNNDISLFSWDGPEITHGLASLTNDIATFAPNCVLLLGNTALKAAKDPFRAHPLTPNRFSFKNANWRGSLFSGLGPFDGRKCLCSYHPAYCLRDYGCTPFLMLDIEKAVREAAQPRLNLPLRNISVDLSLGALLAELRRLREQKRLVACDIEGGVSTLSCISFADSPNSAFIVPFFRKDGSRCWPLDQELRLLRATAEVLEDPEVPKVMQYGLYDSFVLHYSYGIVVRGFVQDTMFKHWELYSELAKDDDKRTKSAKRGMGLAVQASIYTDEPYYKGDRKSQDDKTFFEYCCRDSLVTYEICDKLEQIFHGPGGRGLSRTDLASMRQHYEFNCSLLPVFRYLMWRGIRYDHVLARTRRDLLARAKCEAQARLNGLTGHGFSWKSQSEILSHATALMGLKRAKISSFDDLAANSTKAYRESAVRLRDLMHQRAPDLSVLGEIEDLCEVSLNTDSPKQFIPFLYETLKLPVQYKEDKETKELRPTSDYEALIKLARFVSQTPSDPRLPFINAAIDIRAVDTRRGMLEIGHDQDGRIRCGYNPVGSNTGRVSCSESPTGSGYNLQTIPNYTSKADAPGGLLGDRDLFLSDPGYWFFQCDLSGADGWTVAAYSAMLGDRNLLEDYLAGLKPANILALILRGMATEHTDRETFKSLKKKVSKDDWDYFACKRVQHGCCVTQEHEVLTKDGWKGIQDVEDREEILVYQQETGNCWFEKPTHWTREFYSGPLCVFEGTAFSLRCTPNHRILLDDNGLKVRTAKECLTKKSGRIPYSGKFIGGYEAAPSKLICAIHADGCLSSNGKDIQFHFKKERKIKRLRALLVGRAFHEYLCADGSTQFSVPITLDLARGGIRPGKQMLKWTGSAMQDYANEIENWDGCRQGQNIRFFSANADFLHWARTIIHMSGKGSVYQGTRMSGFGSVIHQASVNNRSFAWLNSMERKEEQASEMIFCPTVSTGFFFVRRNKHISITGNSYLEGGLTVSRNIFKDSEGKFYLSPAECEKLKEAFFSRYRGIRLWHDWVARRLRERPVLIAASGQVRQFFGRRDEILTKAVAFEPQANTTYATNLALLRLWTDPENRLGPVNRPILRIEPLHQVHDAVCGQFRKEDTAWATAKIKSYFDNPLKIAGQNITIPFEGGFGPSWGNLKEGVL